MIQLVKLTIRNSALACLLASTAVSAMAAKISVSTSQYGVGETMEIIGDVTIDGVDFQEAVIPTTSTTGGYIYDYYVLSDANNASLTGFNVTIPVTDLDTLFPGVTPYGVLGCDSINDAGVTDCVSNAESNSAVVAMETISGNPQLIDGGTEVEFQLPNTVPAGTAQGLALFVTEDVAPVPEPRLWPVLGLALVGFLVLRRRSVKLT